jgi:hypothetical protein
VDVKPSNIFIDADGLVWLGDYGSCQFVGTRLFGSGTPIYQTASLAANACPQLDFVCLATSIAEKAGLMPSLRVQHTLAELGVFFQTCTHPRLHSALLDLLKLSTPAQSNSTPPPSKPTSKPARPHGKSVLKNLATRMRNKAMRATKEAAQDNEKSDPHS